MLAFVMEYPVTILERDAMSTLLPVDSVVTPLVAPAAHCAQCGAAFPPAPAGGGAAGYGVIAGKRVCYACCDKRERDYMASPEARAIVVYVSGRYVTTWTGGKLGTIVDSWGTTVFGRRAIAYRVRGLDGRMWHGRHGGDSCGDGMALKLNRNK